MVSKPGAPKAATPGAKSLAKPKWQAKKPPFKAKPSAAVAPAQPEAVAPAPAAESDAAPPAAKPARKAGLPENPY